MGRPANLTRILTYSLPGNIRELQNVLERASKRSLRLSEDNGRTSSNELASVRSRAGRNGGATLRNDSGHDQSLGSPSGPDDRLPPTNGRESAGDLWAICR